MVSLSRSRSFLARLLWSPTGAAEFADERAFLQRRVTLYVQILFCKPGNRKCYDKRIARCFARIAYAFDVIRRISIIGGLGCPVQYPFQD